MVYYILNITGNIRKALNGENIGCAGADPEILKMGGSLCRPPWLANKEYFRFQMV